MANDTTLSLSNLREAVQIQEQIEKLQGRLNAVLNRSSAAKTTSTATSAPQVRRKMSAAARAKIAAAARARWAKVKGTAAAAKPAAKKPAAAPAKKKGGLTPEGRARLAAAMKARWAARKKGGSDKA